MWKSTNSNGWEYLIVWEDLGSSLMYAKLCVILIVHFNNIIDWVEW